MNKLTPFEQRSLNKIYRDNRSVLSVRDFINHRHVDKPENHTTNHNFFNGAEFKTPDLDWEKYPCCGGKGKKWVRKSPRSHRMTLVNCDHKK